MQTPKSRFSSWCSLCLEGLVDALVPPRCTLCGARALDVHAELACGEHELPEGLPGARCDRCAGTLPAGVPHAERCAICRRGARSFARTFALADYTLQPAIQAWVLGLKYGGRKDLAEPLGRALARCFKQQVGTALDWQEFAICPVPLHRWRRFERGYDQAEQLARVLGRELGLSVQRLLARVRATAPQGAPGSSSRGANVRGVFRARGPVQSPGVLLVDDVLTSGSTASECARVLKRAGAERVWVLCVARARGEKRGQDEAEHDLLSSET